MTNEDLRELRRKIDLTQTEMASEIGLSLSHYQKLEAGTLRLRAVHDNAARYVALSHEVVPS